MINLILDVNNVAWRSYYARAYSRFKGSRGNFGHIYGSFRQITKMIGLCKNEPFKLIFSYDRKPDRKKALYPEYKQNRKHPDFNPVPDVEELFKYIPSEIVFCDGEESDDVIASYIDENSQDTNIVNTTDKDLWQLLNNENVQIISKEIITDLDIRKKFNLTIEESHKIALYKSMYGDGGDNIPNICTRFTWKTIGPVFKACDGTPDDFLVKAKEILSKKHYDKLMDKEQMFRLNYDLVKLRPDIDYQIIENPGWRERLEGCLISWGCYSLLNYVDNLNW